MQKFTLFFYRFLSFFLVFLKEMLNESFCVGISITLSPYFS